ncbi:MAG: hypothetical protein HCA25_23870 [Dolichospermum sp. DET50]|nr:hypothetical protein [Dolichospermum sp. DET66]MBS3035199.1 hypothetical protein [Dolichospermum sp. DET67]MBS3040399.1 hypothetical protein [Dolichospermum sp. DET50]QSX67548.1 MAG: hypothetical protein EZY12_23145 [Dolichospermum sp. DET69]
MPILTLSESQIIELVKQLPPESKRVVLLALAKESENGRESRMEYAETQLHNLCTGRGLRDFQEINYPNKRTTEAQRTQRENFCVSFGTFFYLEVPKLGYYV